jgi:uncharacterized protein (TIGR02231 family)
MVFFFNVVLSSEEIKSKITSVSVYSDRAQVTRTAILKLAKGEQLLELKNLPENVDPSSIQVSGAGNGIVKDVSFKRVYFTETQNPKVKTLLEERVLLEEQVAALNGRIANARSEKNFVEEIARKLTGVTDKSNPAELSPEKWIKMVEFYRSRLDSLDREVRSTDKQVASLQVKISKIQNEINDLGQESNKVRNVAEITLLMNSESALTLNVSYIVYGPSWRPVYDLRISTENKKMNLSYMALIRQNTTEDWEKAQIKLSTAQPQIGGDLPVLQPWRVDFYRPPTPVRREYGMEKESKKKSAMMMKSMAPAAIEETMSYANDVAAPEPSLIAMDASVESTNATAVSFVVPGENTIASDNQEHKVSVASLDFSADFSYSTVPKLSEAAYLRAKVENSSEYPLLAGETNVFLDNNYVSRALVNFVAPGEEFWTSVGTDPGIKVEYKFIKKYESQAGVFSKKSKFVYEYILKVSNKRKRDEEIVVQDQFPISGNQEIKVELLEPKISATETSIKVNESNIIEWKQTIKSGSVVEIPLKFSVEYPKGERITGLIK